MSLVRDRLEYTRHCFGKLREHAGIGFDHYVLDQGSDFQTSEWLWEQRDQFAALVRLTQNVGINAGINRLLRVLDPERYDVVVKFDNDCELTMPDTLRDVARLAKKGNALLSPRILGLNNPPASTGTFLIEDELILDIPQIGGIFIAAPAAVYGEFHFDEAKLLDDDVDFCWWWRGVGGRCGYVERLTANHYETTTGQWARYPEYFARTLREGKPSL